MTAATAQYLLHFSNLEDNTGPESLDRTKENATVNMGKEDGEFKTEIPSSDWIKMLGVRLPLAKSYATFAHKRRNKRPYLPVPSKLKCNRCYYRTHSRFALKLHMEQNHSDKTWYLCLGCDHMCDSEAEMREHVESKIMLQSLELLKSDENGDLPLPDKLNKNKGKEKSRYSVKKKLSHNGGYICIGDKQTHKNQQMVL